MTTAPTGNFDSSWVRARFPALATDWILMDNAGGSVTLATVVDRVTDYMRSRMVQVGASYPMSRDATARIVAGHRAVETLFGAGVDEVVLGPSSTVLTQTISRALRPLWDDGDEIVVTDLDHETNIGPWRALEATGLRIREWRFRRATMRLELDDLEPLLGERTRLVAFTHCSNVVGQIHDVRAIADRVRAAGALTCVDGVAFAPHRRVDVRALGVDLYFASLYKVYGPHVSALFGRRDLLRAAHSQYHYFIGEADVPYKLEPGNVTHELAAALPAIVDYLEQLDRHHGGGGSIDGAFAKISAHERALARPILEFLDAHPRVRLLGSAVADADRAPTISFTVDGLAASAIPPRLDAHRIAIRFGHFYAHRMIDRLGLLERDGVVRISLVHYNTPAEVERLLGVLESVLRK